jgi:tetratricopeptide (TPR) repeat protein
MSTGQIVVLLAVRMGMIPADKQQECVELVKDLKDFEACLHALQGGGYLTARQVSTLQPKISIAERGHHKTEFLRGLGVLAPHKAQELSVKHVERLAQSDATMEEILKEEGIDISEDTQRVKVPTQLLEASLGPGRQFGRYTLVEEIGRGATGIVFKAIDPTLNREVALKILRSLENDEGTLRFIQEAQSIARLKHPSILGLHDFGVESGRYFFTMDYVEGHALDQLVLEQGLAQTAAVEIVRDISRAVAYAHGQGILHRDVKPENILVDRHGHGYIVDFGLAREVRDQEQKGLTQAGAIFGTPEYMPPEQARADHASVDHRSDVYSLGATLYFALTKKPPFMGLSWRHVLDLVISQDPVPPRQLGKVDRELETVCLHAMEKEKERRYRSAGELADDLDRYLKSEPVLATRSSFLYRFWRNRKNRVRVAIALPCLIAAAVGGYLIYDQAQREIRYRNTVLQGDAAVERGDLAGALEAYDRALALRPDPAVRSRRDAAADLKARREQEARLAKYAAIVEQADAAMNRKEFEPAIELYRDALAVLPRAEAKDRLEKAIQAKGAVEALGEAQRFIRTVEHGSMQDWTHIKRDIDAALIAARRAAKIHAETADTAFVCARAFHVLGDWKRAAEQYDLALAKDPKHQNGLFGRMTLNLARAGVAHSRVDRSEWNASEAAQLNARALADAETLQTAGADALQPDQRSLLPGYRQLAELKFSEARTWARENASLQGAAWIQGLAAVYLGDAPGALEAFDRILSDRPKFFMAFLVPTVKGNLKSGEASMADYSRSIELNPAFAEAYFGRGHGWLSLKAYPSAEGDLSQALRLDEEFASALLARARAYEALGRHADALKDLDSLLKLREDATGLRLRAAARRALNNLEAAVEDLTRYLELRPRDASALAERALCRWDLQKIEPALADLTEALKADPGFSEAYGHRGALLEGMGRWDEALKDYTERVRLEPNLPEASLQLGGLLEKMDRWEEAVRTYSDLLGRKEDAQLFVARGFARRHLKDLGGALADFEKATSFIPCGARAHLGYGLVKFDLKDLSGAYTCFDRALRTQPDMPEALYHRGVVRVFLKEYPLAISDLEKAETGSRRHYFMAAALNGVGRFEEALREAERAEQESPSDPEAAYQSALASESRRNVPGALAALDRVLKLKPDHREALYSRACLLLDGGETKKAEADLSALIRLEPRFVPALTRRAVLALRSGDLNAGMKDAEAALAIEPQNASARMVRANLLGARGDHAAAIQEYSSILASDPRSLEALTNRGLSKHKSGDYLGALKDYQEALRLDSRWVPALVNRAMTQLAIKELEGAIATSTEALAIDDGNLASYMNRGTARLQKGDAKGSVGDFDRAISLKPDYPEAYLNRALARSTLGEYAGAEEDLKQVIRLRPEYAAARLNLAATYMLSGREEAALEELHRAIQIDPSFADAYVNRAQIHLRRGEHEKADADILAALRLSPHSGGAHMVRGLILESIGDKEPAMASYDRAVELSPFDGVARFSRGVLRFKLGRIERALEDFEAALKLAPDHKQAFQPYLDECRRLLREGTPPK